MLVVGFDTATPAVSVALHDGERVVSEASAADGRRHGELLTPMIAQVLSDAGASRADLTAVAQVSDRAPKGRSRVAQPGIWRLALA